jgi:uncharacterized protein (DUF1778 family)
MTKEEQNQDLIECFKNLSPQIRILSNRDRDIFLAMLDADDEPNEKLVEAFRIHDEVIAK